MKAFSKRVLSLTMATAMALSIAAVPTTDANAASKYSLTKRTAAYTGKTYNYYLKGVSKSQYAKVSVSGTAKKLVTVKLGSKKIKSSTKINGTGKTLTLKVKASKASSKKYALTAKIYNKKTKKLVKTLKTPTVTVYNNYIKSISGETTVDAGKTTTLKAVKKYSQSTKAVTWSSSNTAVATVAADGTVTGVAAGSSVITAKCGNYSKSVRVTVMPVVEAKGVSAVLTNGVAGYTDVAYVNQDAVVVVTARDENGKAVPNASVVIQAPTAGYDIDGNAYPGVVGDKAKTTDANGQATFVIGYPNSGKIKITNVGYADTVAYTISVNANIANVETTIKGNVRFAALDLDTIDVNTVKTKLERGTQAVDKTGSIQCTTPLHKDATGGTPNDYVATQQVSEAGKNNHEVVFEVKPSLYVPGTANTNTGVFENTVLVGKETGTYDTYDNKTAVATIEEDTSLLRYATLYVTDINLSKYSHLEVEAFTDTDDKFEHPVANSKQYVYGEQKQGSFAYQIPVATDAVKKVRVSIISAGQVDTDRNSGCKIESIKYVYNEKSNGTGALHSEIPGVSIDWDKSSAVYTNERPLIKNGPVDDIASLGITPDKSTDTFTYKVPEFPYTGDAVITERDVNGKIVAYYLAPTENAKKYIRDTASGKFKFVANRFTNQNEISALLANALCDDAVRRDLSSNPEFTSESTPKPLLHAYKATVEEIAAATASTFSTENNGFVLKINSEKVGYTSMKGEIKGIDASLLDASNKYLYTSVQWNPLPNINTNAAYLAFVGQKVDVIAQLVDKNNNPVTEKNVSVTFSGYENAYNAAGDQSVKITDVTRTGGSVKTDTNGQAKLTLSAAEFAQLVGVSAKSASSKYFTALYVGKVEGTPVEMADIYWVNANLSYANSSYFFAGDKHVNYTDAKNSDYKNGTMGEDKDPNGDPIYDYSTVTAGNAEKFVYVETQNNEITRNIAHPTVGQNWEYATRAIGDHLTKGVLEGKDIVINNININTKAAASNKGTYTISTDGKGIAKGSSKYAQKDYITSKLDASSVTSTTSFKVDGKEYANVGTGTANIGASFKLGVIWQKDGEAINTINVSGFNAVSGNTSKKVVYVKVTDASGVNPMKDAKVTFEIDNNKFTGVADGAIIGTLADKKVSVSTNSLGIAAVEVQDTDLAISTIVTARVEDNIDDTATQTINWVNAKAPLSLVSAKSGADMKTVVLTFNNDIEAASLKNDQFVVSYRSQADGKTYNVKVTDASVNGNVVTLTLETALSNVEYTVTVNEAKEDGIEYKVVDTTGASFGTTSQKCSDETQFVAGSNATVEIKSAGVGATSIDLDGIKLPLAQGNAHGNMVVTVDDVVVYNDDVATSLSGTNVFNTTIAVPKLQKDSVVTVYYYGASTSYTVQ